MTAASPGDERDAPDDPGEARRRVAALQAEADAVARRYERNSAIRLSIVFFPVPFAVLVARLHMDAWHYYLAGGSLAVLVAAMIWLDRADAARRDAASERVRRARFGTDPRMDL